MELEPTTVLNARQAFLGQEPLAYESFLDAAGFLDLNLTLDQADDPHLVRAELERETAASKDTPSRNTEYFVAARQVVKMWVYTS